MEVILQYRRGRSPSTPGTRVSEAEVTASDLLAGGPFLNVTMTSVFLPSHT